MASSARVYAFGVGATVLGRGIEVGSSFAIVWLLTHMLAVADYGHFVIALTLIELLGLFGAGGLEAVVVYRSSRSDAPPGELDGGEVAGAAFGWGLGGACLAAAGVAWAAPAIALAFDKPEAGFWIRSLAFLVPLQVARAIYAAWHRARQRVPQAVLLGYALPRFATALALAGVALAAPTPPVIVAALVAGPLLVLVPWFCSAPLDPSRLRGGLERWDVQYTLKLSFNRLLAQGITHADILLLGALSTSVITAQYGVASRIALLTSLAFSMLMPTFVSRVGYLHGRDRRDELAREYDQTRSVALLGALVFATFLGLLGDDVLALFGDFDAATPVLWILAAAWLAQASFGMNRSYLGLAGYGGWALLTSSLLLATNAALCVVWIPRFGGEGAALASLVSIVGVRALTSAIIWKLERFPTWSVELALLTSAAVGTLLAGAAGWLDETAVGGGLLLVLALFAGRRYRQWSSQVGHLLAEFRRPSEAG